MAAKRPTPSKNSRAAEEAVLALFRNLREFFLGRRQVWMHDFPISEFDKGVAHALTGLVRIPAIKTALDAIDASLVRDLDRWHDRFQRPAKGA